MLQRFLRTSGAVFNASDRQLTDVEVEALALGPGFVPYRPVSGSRGGRGVRGRSALPTPTDNHITTDREIAPFINRINTAIHFSDPRRPVFDRVGTAALAGHLAASGWLRAAPAVRSAGDGAVTSGWTAPPRQWTSDPAAAGLLRRVSAMRRRMVATAAASKSRVDQSAISNALRNLHSDPTIRVCISDKGSTVVVWCSLAYQREALHHLSNINCYRRLSGGRDECCRLVQVAAGERGALALSLRTGKHINHQEFARIESASATPSPIRFLPKMRKPLNPKTGTFHGRPIVSTVSSVVRPLDKYLAIITRPLLAKIPFCLTSTDDLLARLRHLNTTSLPTDYDYLQQLGIYTADIVSLFPSVPWFEGVKACVHFYSEWFPWLVRVFASENKLPPPPPELFSDLVNFVVRNSFIHFPTDDSYYQQTSGVAMGACISVYVANCYVWSAMRPVCLDLGLPWIQPAETTATPLPPMWSDIIFLARYVDDFLVVSRSASSFHHVLSAISSNSSLLFTTPCNTTTNAEKPRSRVAFLDLELSIDSAAGLIHTSPRLDSAPGCSYLHAGSCHPPGLLRSIPYAQLLRLRRNSSSFSSFVSAAAVVMARLKMRGYSHQLLKKALTRVSRLKPPELHNTRVPITPSNPPGRNFMFIATFDGGRPRHCRSVRRLLDDVLARASDFYERDSNPIGAMLGRSKASLVFKTLRKPRR